MAPSLRARRRFILTIRPPGLHQDAPSREALERNQNYSSPTGTLKALNMNSE